MFELFVIQMNDPRYNFYQLYNSGMAERILPGRKKTHGLRKLSRFCVKLSTNLLFQLIISTVMLS